MVTFRWLLICCILLPTVWLCGCITSKATGTFDVTSTAIATQVTPSAPRNPLIAEPCKAPCWQNITPGVTTKDEVSKILRQGPEVATGCRDFNEPPFVGFRCNSVDIWLTEQKDKVANIVMMPSQLVAFSEVVEKYGVPNVVLISDGMGIPERPWTSATVYYAQLGLTITFDNPQKMLDYSLRPDMEILQFTYSEPISGDRLLEELRAKSLSHVVITGWHGFSDYKQYLGQN